MAGEIVNTYTNEDTDIGAMQLALDKVFKGFDMLSLTNMSNTTVPAIAAGSVFEINGGLIKFDAEEAISTTDPGTSSTVANGTVYIMVDGTAMTAAFTATSPTWSDSKQGFYGTGDFANSRYVPVCATKATAAYSNKRYIGYRNLKALDFDDIDLTCDDITCDDITADTVTATTLSGNWSGGDIDATHVKIGATGTALHGLVVLTGTLSSGASTVNYPSGYTQSNTVVLSAMIDNETAWVTTDYGLTDFVAVYVELESGHIHVKNHSGIQSGDYKIVIART